MSLDARRGVWFREIVTYWKYESCDLDSIGCLDGLRLEAAEGAAYDGSK
jgi:hypothetical protein